jgi:DNA-binding NarL/FixJ family response regulator
VVLCSPQLDCFLGEIVISHPFFSLPNGLQQMEKHHALTNDSHEEILLYAFHGYTSKKIAKALPLDDRTIEKYIANAKKKLNARNITHAVKKAFSLGLINF